MSETAPKAPVKPAPVITRNGVSKQLTWANFGKKAGVKRDGTAIGYAGAQFATAEFSIATMEDDIKWAGSDWLISITNKRLKGDFAEIFLDYYLDKEDNIVDPFPMEAYLAALQDFTEGVAKLADLTEEVDLLVGQAQDLVTSEDSKFGEVNDDGAPTDAAKATQEQVLAINMKIKPLRARIMAIKARYAAAAEAREAKKAAKETAAKAQAVAA